MRHRWSTVVARGYKCSKCGMKMYSKRVKSKTARDGYAYKSYFWPKGGKEFQSDRTPPCEG